MSAHSSFQLTLQNHTYYIHARANSSVLEIAQDSQVVGSYEPRWLGRNANGGYWLHFKEQINSALLLNMGLIARLIDQHREQALDTCLQDMRLEGHLRSLTH
ncbi:hypothetical protein [Alcaligenes endophyticus]|uniref:Uncharacterized protein n=1 Tax=Alcaligenes endophyticus TaxID=1929088 RepID=A0ABT8EKU6_9BURK|nr:hypothetical protein [Alcaligenes endophyticus]MCX5590724.1 hypothetical protein [Alcaligenes endophyticus]MDN4121912.1 hypothetical protein [Alcaligenes endophyticus]